MPASKASAGTIVYDVEQEYRVMIRLDDGSERERFHRQVLPLREKEIFEITGVQYRVNKIIRKPSVEGLGIVEASRFSSRGLAPE